MNKLFAILESKPYRWAFLVVFTLTTLVYCLMLALGETGLSALASIATAVIDWLAIYGFARRQTFLYSNFWKGWFWWSFLYFFVFGVGRTFVRDLSLDPFNLATLGVVYGYYFSFFAMLYRYAHGEDSFNHRRAP